MKIHNFFVDFKKEGIGANIAGAVFEIKDKEIIHQIKNVLKLKVSERVVLCDGKLNELVCELIEIKGGAIKARVLETRKNGNEPAVKVVLYCSILKRENFEWAVQKAVEVGVVEIVPIICERTIKTGFKKERLEKIIKEAAEQSGRGILPVLSDARELKETLNYDNGCRSSLNLVFDATGEQLGTMRAKLEHSLGYPISKLDEVGIFIGPEGGWSDGELETFCAIFVSSPNNFKIASLGKTTLRAETAAVVGVYSAINLLF